MYSNIDNINQMYLVIDINHDTVIEWIVHPRYGFVLVVTYCYGWFGVGGFDVFPTPIVDQLYELRFWY
jgi:hypothetical protein